MTDTTIANPRPSASPALRAMAHVVSYLFHPLFISAYVIAFLIFWHPYAFAGFSHRDKVFRFGTVVLSNTLLPLIAVFLMWRLELIGSMRLRTQKDRMIPYIVAMTFYWWSWMVFKNLPDIPPLAVHLLLGAFLAICGGWFANIFFKISMHSIAMGGALMFFFLLGFNDAFGSTLYISIALVFTGLVCSSRLILSEHSAFEVWAGLFVGLVSQYIAWMF